MSEFVALVGEKGRFLLAADEVLLAFETFS
jgi:hypothetical protein